MNEPPKPIHWVTRKLLGRRASHFKTVADYSKAELAQFQAEFQRRVQLPAKPQRAAKALAFLVGSLGFIVLILFMFTPLFVPLGQLVGFSVALAGAILLTFVTAFAGLLLFFRTQPSCSCPSCALPVGVMLASFCPVCGKRSLKEPAVNDYKQLQAARCHECGSTLTTAHGELEQSFRNCHCTHCGIPLATADGPDFAGIKLPKGNACLLNAIFWYLGVSLVLRFSGLSDEYALPLGLVAGVVAYAWLKHRSAKPKPPA